MAKYIDDIMAKIRELSEVPPQRVVEEVALPDFDEGQKMPYVAVVFGTPGHISQATSIVSQLNDGYRVFFLCHRASTHRTACPRDRRAYSVGPGGFRAGQQRPGSRSTAARV